MAPVYFALRASDHFQPMLVSTGQHRQMLDQALDVFGIRPDVDLGLMQPNQTLPALTARVMVAMTDWLEAQRPDSVLVQGDTTTVLATAIASFYAGIPLGHVEAGLRTGNLQLPYPEEMNRRLTTPLARWHFCPTDLSRENLLNEGINPTTCHVTGNTVIDSLLWVRSRLRSSGVTGDEIAQRCGIPRAFAETYMAEGTTRRWILVTGHRRESFGAGFENICRAVLALLARYPDLGILYPVHLNPQVQEPVNRMLGAATRVALIPPVGYTDFIALLDRCHLALSDSGGVQEEAPSLGKPVLVTRETTERPEGVTAGTCRLVGTDPDLIVSETSLLLDNAEEYKRRSTLRNPYGDGDASRLIFEVLHRDLGT